ncbi:MAG: hypothetical protein ACI84E_000980 [Planctomycetota bacterium]|jgi:hypothetical protein
MVSRMLKGSWTNAGFTLFAGLSLLSAGCSGGSGSGASSGSSGSFIIQACSLGCNGGEAGSQISCGVTQVAVNEGISILFSSAVDLSTVNKNTFQVIDLATGKTPPGSFTLNPTDPKTLIFRPQLTFDATGNPVFGLSDSSTYAVFLPGSVQDPGSEVIRSVGGKPNTARMSCTINAIGILDPVPGPPKVTISVDVVTQQAPLVLEEQAVNEGVSVINAYSESTIRLSFDDIMNPATLVNPVTGVSSTLRVFVDPDGNVSDPTDQVELFGTYTIAIDEQNFQTQVIFTPSTGLPSSGSGLVPRKIVVSVPSLVTDLGSNSIVNPGQATFSPQFLQFPPVILPGGTGESFDSPLYLDAPNTGAAWGGGALIKGILGGSGKLGPLIVDQDNSPFVLNTDSQVWSNFDIITEGSATFPPSVTPPSLTITDGIFEFSRISVEAGAQLVLQGSNPARLLARGELLVQGSGLLDVSGGDPADTFTTPSGHDSTILLGGTGGTAGPGGGAGGRGADRRDDTDPSLIAAGGVSNPGAVIDGSPGIGVGGTPGLVSGGGGLAWPPVLPANTSDLGGFIFDIQCRNDMTAGQGGGGGYATSGTSGVAIVVSAPFNPFPPPGIIAPDTPGGDASTLALTPIVRELNPDSGNLRGGAGGGGGGMSLLLSLTNGSFGNCVVGKQLQTYNTHSGGGGGGGGGAVELQAGSFVRIDGVVDASGGTGASGQNTPFSFLIPDQASAGGGGSGGAVLIRSVNVQIASIDDRIDVTGGLGGRAAGNLPGSMGGIGGLGLVRIESPQGPQASLEATKINPFDATPGSESGGALSTAILSVGQYVKTPNGPSGRNGAQSCWIIPSGNFFVLNFTEDDFTDPLNPELGWDLDVILNLPGFEPFSFRDANDANNPFGFAPDVAFGTDLGGTSPAPLVVRFQGAHFKKKVESICDVDLDDPLGVTVVGSQTPWMRHPSELNDYWDLALPGDPDLAALRRPNMFRYQIIFDGNSPLASIVAGVTNLKVKGTPD